MISVRCTYSLLCRDIPYCIAGPQVKRRRRSLGVGVSGQSAADGYLNGRSWDAKLGSIFDGARTLSQSGRPLVSPRQLEPPKAAYEDYYYWCQLRATTGVLYPHDNNIKLIAIFLYNSGPIAPSNDDWCRGRRAVGSLCRLQETTRTVPTTSRAVSASGHGSSHRYSLLPDYLLSIILIERTPNNGLLP